MEPVNLHVEGIQRGAEQAREVVVGMEHDGPENPQRECGAEGRRRRLSDRRWSLCSGACAAHQLLRMTPEDIQTGRLISARLTRPSTDRGSSVTASLRSRTRSR